MAETFAYDKLIGGDFPIVTSAETLLSGQSVSRGAILGKVTTGTVPTSGTADASNTGNGTVTGVTGGVDTLPGVYTIKNILAVTNGGQFNVVNPIGQVIGQIEITAGAGGTGVFTSNEINFTITDGTTDFALGDKFTITVPVGSGKLKIIDSAAIDGSGKPYAVAAETVDASAADKAITVYLSGQFNVVGLSVGGSDTVAQHATAMRALCMYQRAFIAA